MKKDVGWKSYLRDNSRYADIINGVGCAGKQLVKASDLSEADTEEMLSYDVEQYQKEASVIGKDVRKLKKD